MAEGSIYRLDWSRVNLRGGAMSVGVIVGVAAVLILFGTLGTTVGLAALFVMIGDQPGTLRNRLTVVFSFTVVGALLAFVGAWAGDSHSLVAGVLMVVIVYLATVAAALGKPAAVRGLLMAIWVVLALSISGSVDAPAKLALAFLIGGLIAGVGVGVYGLLRPSEESGAERPPVISTLIDQVRAPLGQFALIRGLAAGLATYIGTVLFPNFPVWTVIAVLVILQQQPEATRQIGLLRTVGTVLGVAIASAVLIIIGDGEPVVVSALLASGFGMIALQKVNYTVFTLFLTAMLVFSLHITGDDAIAGGIARLLATLVGAGIAFTAIFVTTRTQVTVRG
jgi:uncharacterized membrane protein YccC